MDNLISKYNYDAFVPEKFEQWLNFEASPKIGGVTEDFSLWNLDHSSTRLRELLTLNQFTFIEFGSFS